MNNRFTQFSVEIDPFEVSDEHETVLREIIAEQCDGLERDEIQSVKTIVLSIDGGLNSHGKVLKDNEATDSISTNNE